MYGLDTFAGPSGTIENDSAFQRIAGLLRRSEVDDQTIRTASEILRTRELDDEGEENLLRRDQVVALKELVEMRGLFAPMAVGSGKTLVELLAATVVQAQRPIMVLPASLREKTRREYAEYFRNWRVRLPKLVSYEEMGRLDRDGLLSAEMPDLLIFEEAHRVKNFGSAVTRRFLRYIEEHNPMVCMLSGTLISDSFMDYWHLAKAALGALAPVPLMRSEAERYAAALDRDTGRMARVSKGALESLPGGYFEWLRGSRGVVASKGSDCPASIELKPWSLDLPKDLKDLAKDVVDTSTRPDGEPLESWDVPDVLCQLAQGCYYIWDPLPPLWWLEPRKRWHAYVRAILGEHIPGLDSPLAVASSLDHGRYVPAAAEGAFFLKQWRQVKKKFEPNPVPVWVHVEPLVRIAEHAHKTKCIVWTRHSHPGDMLGKLGLPYYGAGANPESAPANTAICCSISAHATGKNLQKKWHRSLVLTPPAGVSTWEQLIGRTHRIGQKSDTVVVEYLDAISYHRDVVRRAVQSAKHTAKSSGFLPKLLVADSEYR